MGENVNVSFSNKEHRSRRKRNSLLQMSLGDRHKAYEEAAETHVDLTHAVVIRLDGRAFHTFTKGFNRPFDVALHNAFVFAAKHLMDVFPGASRAYTQSDEITLVFPVREDSTGQRVANLPFNGRVQKIVSTAASAATGSFHAAIQEELKDRPELLVKKAHTAQFDARVFNMNPDEEHSGTEEEACGNVELQNNLLWRYRDCIKNSISAFARIYCSAKDLHGLSGPEMISLVKDRHGKDWDDLPDWAKYGTFVTKELYETDEHVKRHRFLLRHDLQIKCLCHLMYQSTLCPLRTERLCVLCTSSIITLMLTQDKHLPKRSILT